MATASVPNDFVNGTAAEAEEVDANFQSLVDFINDNVIHVDGSKDFTQMPSGPLGKVLQDVDLKAAMDVTAVSFTVDSGNETFGLVPIATSRAEMRKFTHFDRADVQFDFVFDGVSPYSGDLNVTGHGISPAFTQWCTAYLVDESETPDRGYQINCRFRSSNGSFEMFDPATGSTLQYGDLFTIGAGDRFHMPMTTIITS